MEPEDLEARVCQIGGRHPPLDVEQQLLLALVLCFDPRLQGEVVCRNLAHADDHLVVTLRDAAAGGRRRGVVHGQDEGQAGDEWNFGLRSLIQWTLGW